MYVNMLVRIAGSFWAPIARMKRISRKARLARFSEDGVALPIVDIDLRSPCKCLRCRGIGDVSHIGLRRYGRATAPWSILDSTRATAAMIDLQALGSHAAFVKAVATASRGNDTRMVAKARRHGYAVRLFDADSLPRSIALIRESRRVRSQGLMVDSLFKASDRLVDTPRAFEPPACSSCWILHWGVFDPRDDRLVAFAGLRRSGNYVELDAVMGHAESLKLGAVKLLVFDIMHWLLESREPLVANVRYFHYGAIENGSVLTAQWRRYYQFKPVLLGQVSRDASVFPTDFSAMQYRLLHRDVARQGVDPRLHYALYGAGEGRAYRLPILSWAMGGLIGWKR